MYPSQGARNCFDHRAPLKKLHDETQGKVPPYKNTTNVRRQDVIGAPIEHKIHAIATLLNQCPRKEESSVLSSWERVRWCCKCQYSSMKSLSAVAQSARSILPNAIGECHIDRIECNVPSPYKHNNCWIECEQMGSMVRILV